MSGDAREELTDADLVHRASAGDADAFGLLVARHQAHVFRLAHLLTRSRDEAEDVLQQTFLSAWRALGAFRGEASMRTWLLTIARNAAFARRQQALREPIDPTPVDDLGLRAGWGGPSPEDAAMSSERAALFAAALGRLAEEDRAILTLRDLEGLSGEETASVLGLSLAAMKSRLHRARLALAAEVREEMRHAAR
ncbi:MAG: sigma-70 family RNA polymerase sigma factor [Vicinamibacterales bacterium]